MTYMVLHVNTQEGEPRERESGIEQCWLAVERLYHWEKQPVVRQRQTQGFGAILGPRKNKRKPFLIAKIKSTEI